MRFGPTAAEHTDSAWQVDMDNDTGIDLVVKIMTEVTGVVCTDTDATLNGELCSDRRFSGTDSITPANCETNSCHP